MGPFGLPWLVAVIYFLSFIGVPAVAEILIHTKWWKKKLDYYYSFNKK